MLHAVCCIVVCVMTLHLHRPPVDNVVCKDVGIKWSVGVDAEISIPGHHRMLKIESLGVLEARKIWLNGNRGGEHWPAVTNVIHRLGISVIPYAAYTMRPPRTLLICLHYMVQEPL